MIKGVNDRFDDYSISSKMRQILLHWGYEFVEDVCPNFFVVVVHTKMSYYQFNWQELLQKAKDRYHNGTGKEKAAEYYIEKEEVLKENAWNK